MFSGRIYASVNPGRRYVGRIMEADLAFIQPDIDWLMAQGIIGLDADGAPVWTDKAADHFRDQVESEI